MLARLLNALPLVFGGLALVAYALLGVLFRN